MAKAICISPINEEIQEVVLAKWYKKTGEKVEKDEVIAEIETDKATIEMYADISGYLLCMSAKEGDLVKVNDLIAVVGYPGEDYQTILNQYNKTAYAIISEEIKVYHPKIGKNVFIAPTATVVGKVKLGDECSVWYGAVIRGDEEEITIGNRTNIQDTCVLHADHNEPTIIGEGCIVGHGAIVHGATIGNHTLIGMRATVLNRAKIGNYCIIGAHALVTQDMEIPDYSVVLGSPAKIVKKIPHDQAQLFTQGEQVYVDLAKDYLNGKFLTVEINN